MITFQNSTFLPSAAELVVLNRRGKTTWGLYIKCQPNSANDQNPPQFNLYGLPLPPEGIEGIFGTQIKLPQGETGVAGQPEALLYVWDWSAANDNQIVVTKLGPAEVSVSWSGSCEDAEYYDSRGSIGKFDINCVCAIRYET